MSDDTLYYAVSARGGLVARDKRPLYATREEWSPFIKPAGHPESQLSFRVVQLIPADPLLFGSLPFSDRGNSPDPIAAIITAISNLTADDLVRLSVQRPDGSDAKPLAEFPALVSDASEVRCGYCGVQRGEPHQDYCVTNSEPIDNPCTCGGHEKDAPHNPACPVVAE